MEGLIDLFKCALINLNIRPRRVLGQLFGDFAVSTIQKHIQTKC